MSIRNLNTIAINYKLELDRNPYDFEARCILLHNGTLLTMIRDVTEIKSLERQLIEQKNKAIQTAQLETQFLANMSHEIRTPLNSVLGLTDLVLKTNLSAYQKKYLNIIQSSGDSLLYLINDILDFSKIRAGELAIEKISFSLKNTLGNVIKEMGIIAEKKKIQLIREIEPSVPDHIIGDPHRLKQIITNLINNAIKFTSTGYIELRIEKISKEPYSSNTETVIKFSITDTGIGIPKEMHEKVFGQFIPNRRINYQKLWRYRTWSSYI